MSLRAEPLARALGPEPDPDLPYAPPAPFPPPPIAGLDLPMLDEPLEEPLDGLEGFGEPEPEPGVIAAPHAPHCLYCGDSLPADRPVRFCPHCGQRQAPPECPRCHSEVEAGWRHCVSCGTPLAEG